MSKNDLSLQKAKSRYTVYNLLTEILENAELNFFSPAHNKGSINFATTISKSLSEIKKSIPPKYKNEFEGFIEDQKHRIEKLTPDKYKLLLEGAFKHLEDNKEDAFVYIFRKFFRLEPDLLKRLGNHPEYLDRINDLVETNKEQKISSILWFGEQGRQEHILILKELEKNEEDAKTASAIKKAVIRITERLNPRIKLSEKKSNSKNTVNEPAPSLLRTPNFSEEELADDFQPDRRPWRTLVRVTGIKNGSLQVVLPGWNSRKNIQISKNALPGNLGQSLSPGDRFFAKVNIGAEESSELYFTDFEFNDKK